MKINNVILFFLMAMPVVVSCAEKTNQNSPMQKKENTLTKIENELSQLSVTMEKIMGKAECDTNKQCNVIEFGSRPCGGPASYKAYSSLNTDVPLLLKTSKAHVKLSKTYNEIKSMMSICSVLTPPQVSCNKTCVIKNVNILIQ